MISYVNLGTNNLPQAKDFYTELLAEMGAKPIYESERGVFFAAAMDQPMIVICTPFNKEAASAGNGTMVALKVDSSETVDRMHAKALELGGSCEGEPGYRVPDVLYCAYFRDRDGNKLAATYRAG